MSRVRRFDAAAERELNEAVDFAELSRAGALIGPHDLWLAATCVAHGLTMVTGNVREFARVPGLEIEVWEG